MVLKIKNLDVPWSLAGVFGTLSLCFIVAGLIIFTIRKKQIKDDKINELAAISDLKAGQIQNWVQERLNDANIVGHDNFLGAELMHLRNGRPEASFSRDFLGLAGTLNANREYSEIILTDPSGSIISSLNKSVDRLGPETRAFVSDAVKKKDVLFTDFYWCSSNKKYLLDFISPITLYNIPGMPVGGSVILRIDPYNFIYKLIQSWPFPSNTAETFIVRREGDEVVYLNELRHWKNTAMKLRFPIADKVNLPAALAVQGKEGIVEGLDYRNMEVLADLKKIRGTGWFMVTKIDRSEVFATLRYLLFIITVIVMAFIGAAGVGTAWWWSRQRMNFYREQHEAEDKYRELETQFGYLTRFANDIILLVDRELRVIMFNDRAATAYGYQGEDLSRLTMRDLGDPETVTGLGDQLSLAEAPGGHTFETRHRKKDGTLFPVEISALAVKVGDQKKYQLIIRDITERKLAERKLIALNEELEERVRVRTSQLDAAVMELEAFSYSVSHDLKAPLRAIEGFSKIVTDDNATILDPETTRLLNLVQDNARRMAQLIDDLLAFSRVGRHELSVQRIDMAGLVNSVWDELAAQEQERRFDLTMGPLAEARGDLSLIRQVWTNLLSNAIKFTSNCDIGRIEIGCCSGEGDDAVYFIRDNGVGFDMKYADKLFGVFQRLHSSKEFPGTGVGLALIQRIINRHGGTVWAEAAVNAGATFYFSLNAAATGRIASI